MISHNTSHDVIELDTRALGFDILKVHCRQIFGHTFMLPSWFFFFFYYNLWPTWRPFKTMCLNDNVFPKFPLLRLSDVFPQKQKASKCILIQFSVTL